MRTKTRGGRTEAQAELTKLIGEVAAGKHKGTSATFGVLLTDWLAHLEDQAKRPSTLATYKGHVKNRIRPGLGHLKLSRLDASHLDGFYRDQRTEGLGVQTVRLQHSIISAALEQGLKWGWIPANPARQASPPRDDRDAPGALTLDEVLGLVEQANADEDIDLAVAITLAAMTGARRGELCGLRWSDIDWNAMTLRIERARVPISGQGIQTGKTKTGKPRTVWLDPLLIDRLRWYRSVVDSRRAGDVPADPWLLTIDDGTTPYSPKVLSGQITDLGKRTGITVHTHSLRHYAVTQVVSSGVDVTTASTMFGHSTATMLGTYSHPVVERHAAAARILGRLLEPPKELPQ